MAKRDEAFELFSQGKIPTDPEVVALGVKVETAKRYFRMWKRPQEEPGVAPEMAVLSELPLALLADGALFEYKGQMYMKKRTVYSGEVIAELMSKAHYTNVFTPTSESIYLPPDILVMPK